MLESCLLNHKSHPFISESCNHELFRWISNGQVKSPTFHLLVNTKAFKKKWSALFECYDYCKHEDKWDLPVFDLKYMGLEENHNYFICRLNTKYMCLLSFALFPKIILWEVPFLFNRLIENVLNRGVQLKNGKENNIKLTFIEGLLSRRHFIFYKYLSTQ